MRVAIGLLLLAAGAAADPLFRSWYPQYGAVFQSILSTQCAPEYDAWKSGNQSILLAPEHTEDGTATPGETVVQCILDKTSNFIQANMASAAVLLGITPFALSVLGSSSEESALLYVIARRPLLTTLLLAGSPVVVALRPFEYKDPVGILRSREGRFYSFKLGPTWFILFLEYFIVLASVANVAHVTYQLGVGVVCMILPDSNYLPALWVASGVVVHVIGALCLGSRLRLLSPRGEPWWRSEFTLSSAKSITVKSLPERKLFLALSWITSTSTTFHVIFGTLAYSSIQFISVRDAFGVIGRYTASVTLCRVVLMYELSGLRSSVDSIADGPEGAGAGGEEVTELHRDVQQDLADGIKRVPRIFTFAP
ncbi:hypothetical protein B0H67DRAFT_567161 [Lasiosphaeris hirsuta]|uniref:Uncharacterized protein n=1 Tax=Lasiosphaeris hirsuta TaxID=260670 RepID=A0AA40AXX6_9PEZI|nr:hypothetical protein B0H67DRAFT_567161 [Lasiosphaeris hirsuta]